MFSRFILVEDQMLCMFPILGLDFVLKYYIKLKYTLAVRSEISSKLIFASCV